MNANTTKLIAAVTVLFCGGKALAYDFTATGLDDKKTYYFNVTSEGNPNDPNNKEISPSGTPWNDNILRTPSAECELTYSDVLEKDGVMVYNSENVLSKETRIIIPNIVVHDGKRYHVTKVGDHAFENLTNLASYDFAMNKPIGNYAFKNCQSLKQNLPSQAIGDHAFEDCTSLHTVECYSESIGDSAFYGCVNIQKVVSFCSNIPDEEEFLLKVKVGVNAFYHQLNGEKKATLEIWYGERRDKVYRIDELKEILEQTYPWYGFDIVFMMDPVLGVEEPSAGKTVSQVRYVNVSGIESAEPHQGLNIVVTTYSDGSTSTAKVLR
ncbi:MAG: leucine-rich repeat domain-containing protein [Bacteroidaceae bacterium]|nr:leucine-rich repeat domain-containing protein [Bacteroidaceae bacterium]